MRPTTWVGYSEVLKSASERDPSSNGLSLTSLIHKRRHKHLQAPPAIQQDTGNTFHPTGPEFFQCALQIIATRAPLIHGGLNGSGTMF